MPEISFLMPVFNAEATLEQALDSVIRQTVPDWEMIIVDDGSTDRSASIIKSISDFRVRPVSSEHKGLTAALNQGLKYCRGDWIVRMDADDISHPRRLECLLSSADRHPEVDVWGSSVSLFPQAGLKKGMREYESWLNSLICHDDLKKNLFVECPIAHPSLMVKRKTLERVGGYDEREWPEDYDLVFRLFMAGFNFGKIARVLLFWRYHAQKTSLTDPRYSPQNFFQVKYHFFKKLFPGKERELVIIGAADTGKRWLKHLLDDGFTVSRILDLHPGRIGHKIRGVPVMHPDGLDRIEGFVINTAGIKGARKEVRGWLSGRGLKEWDDFLCVA